MIQATCQADDWAKEEICCNKRHINGTENTAGKLKIKKFTISQFQNGSNTFSHATFFFLNRRNEERNDDVWAHDLVHWTHFCATGVKQRNKTQTCKVIPESGNARGTQFICTRRFGSVDIQWDEQANTPHTPQHQTAVTVCLVEWWW